MLTLFYNLRGSQTLLLFLIIVVVIFLAIRHLLKIISRK